MSAPHLSKGGRVLVHQAGSVPMFEIVHLEPGLWSVRKHGELLECGDGQGYTFTDAQLLQHFNGDTEVLQAIADFSLGYKTKAPGDWISQLQAAATTEKPQTLNRVSELLREASWLVEQSLPNEPSDLSLALTSISTNIKRARRIVEGREEKVQAREPRCLRFLYR